MVILWSKLTSDLKLDRPWRTINSFRKQTDERMKSADGEDVEKRKNVVCQF